MTLEEKSPEASFGIEEETKEEENTKKKLSKKFPDLCMRNGGDEGKTSLLGKKLTHAKMFVSVKT